MEAKNVEKVDSMTKYENETLEAQNKYDEFVTKTEQSERKHEMSFFGEYLNYKPSHLLTGGQEPPPS